MKRLVWWLCGALGAAVLTLTPSAAAQINLRALVQSGSDASLAPLRIRGTDRVSVLVRVPTGFSDPAALLTVAPGLAAFDGELGTLRALMQRTPGLEAAWAPARPLLVDRAAGSLRAVSYRNTTGATGKGSVIGIVDSGLDLEHPDLRFADGRTRVAWLLDLARPPAGRQPELEATYGCSDDRPCAVFSGLDIDELAANDVAGDLPVDAFGHGTHVASLAAGNGASSSDGTQRGIAPEATLIVVRATRSGVAGVFDADLLLATRFIFERAEALGLPAVVNLSLGSDFGNHDGSSTLERALASYVGPEHPGRAIVVAAGNSGVVQSGISADYPEPLGVHTEVHVPRDTTVRVPILTLPGATSVTTGSLAIWLAGRSGDVLDVGVDGPNGELVPELQPGRVLSKVFGSVSINLVNGLTGSGSPDTEGANAAILLLDGDWPSGAVFALRLAGQGSARLWVEATTSARSGGGGALFPRASKRGTITVPASSPEVIAVGATLNRVDWIDHAGNLIRIDDHEWRLPDSITEFTSAGPTADGRLKPDIVAPGAYVAGAMARSVDPRRPGVRGSMFDQPGFCLQPYCLVVDDTHAIASGTSMAAPLVSGAVALLFQRNPSLTQPELRGLLQAGARRLGGLLPVAQQAGAGTLDLERTLEAEQYSSAPVARAPAAAESFMVLADAYAHPDPEWPLRGLVLLRDASGSVADGFDPARLALVADPVHRVEPLQRIAPGAYELAVYPRAGSGGGHLTVRVLFDGAELERERIPIAVDRAVAAEGYVARGGCALAASSPPSSPVPWLALLLLLLARRVTAWSGRPYTLGARTAERRDRTDAPAPRRRRWFRSRAPRLARRARSAVAPHWSLAADTASSRATTRLRFARP